MAYICQKMQRRPVRGDDEPCGSIARNLFLLPKLLGIHDFKTAGLQILFKPFLSQNARPPLGQGGTGNIDPVPPAWLDVFATLAPHVVPECRHSVVPSGNADPLTGNEKPLDLGWLHNQLNPVLDAKCAEKWGLDLQHVGEVSCVGLGGKKYTLNPVRKPLSRPDPCK